MVRCIIFNKKEFYESKSISKNGQHQTGLISSGINSRLDTIYNYIVQKLKYFKSENKKKILIIIKKFRSKNRKYSKLENSINLVILL